MKYVLKDIIINKEINNLIISYGKIDNAQNSFFVNVADAVEIPKYKFKYIKGTDKQIYYKIKQCVESFKGKLLWTLSFDENQDERRYYIIMPKKYAGINCFPGIKSERSSFPYFKEHPNLLFEEDVFGKDVYRETCRDAINDIPRLIQWIESTMSIK